MISTPLEISQLYQPPRDCFGLLLLSTMLKLAIARLKAVDLYKVRDFRCLQNSSAHKHSTSAYISTKKSTYNMVSSMILTILLVSTLVVAAPTPQESSTAVAPVSIMSSVPVLVLTEKLSNTTAIDTVSDAADDTFNTIDSDVMDDTTNTTDGDAADDTSDTTDSDLMDDTTITTDSDTADDNASNTTDSDAVDDTTDTTDSDAADDSFDTTDGDAVDEISSA